MKRFIVLLLIGISIHPLISQESRKMIRDGNKKFEKNDFQGAADAYSSSYEESPSSVAAFNLGNSKYKLQNWEDAIQNFKASSDLASTPALKANALYNLGNAYFKSDQLDESIEAYKKALNFNPDDEQARENLVKARIKKKLLQQQEQKQQQQQEKSDKNQKEDESKDQNSDHNNGDKKDNKNKKDGDNENEKNDESSSASSNADRQDSSDQSPSGSEGEPGKMSKEEVERLLNVIQNEEQKVQEKLRRVNSGTVKKKKDW